MLILHNQHVDFTKSTSKCLFYKIDILDVYFVKSTCLFCKINIRQNQHNIYTECKNILTIDNYKYKERKEVRFVYFKI